MMLKLRLRVKAYFLEHVRGDVFQAGIRRWYADECDQRLRYVYDLGADSVVFDVGGYRGDFASEISRRYDSWVYVFEPIPAFHRSCEDRLRHRPKVLCLPYGLSDKSGSIPMAFADDASGLYNPKNAKAPEVMIMLRSFGDAMDALRLRQVALMKINIEGGEYPLLEHLLDTGLIHKIDRLQIQFHDFAERAVERRESIRSRLQQTHTQDWCYPFVWESWSRREAAS